MNSFIHRIAQVFYSNYKSKINDFTFVFPNRRAGLFFQQYLTEIIDTPVFSPEILTINDCFFSASRRQESDRISLLFRLYELYKTLSKSAENFDDFVFWGEMILSDFDEVDKYRVDAKQLFTNISDLKKIDQIFDVFSEEQKEAIAQFWKSFNPKSERTIEQKFMTAWNILLPLYERFKKSLLAENLSTQGMIFRDVAERLEEKENIIEWKNKKFVFIGFNGLNPCERTLFLELQKRGQADFYWDYEAKELRDKQNRASAFYEENIKLFPSKHPIEIPEDCANGREVELISVSSQVGQSKQIYNIINDLYKKEASEEKKEWTKTGIVLPDENMLVPLLYSLPEQIEKINVTMGFPMKVTPIAGLIEYIFELQRRKRNSKKQTTFYYQNVLNILNHQYIALLCFDKAQALNKEIVINNRLYIDEKDFEDDALLKAIFKAQTDAEEFLHYLSEILTKLQKLWGTMERKQNFQLELSFLYQYNATINRISDLMRSKPQTTEISLETLMRLIRQLTESISIPFVGEPLDGLQIMGILEARGLEFENLIIPSFNEGVFPKKSNPNSFIPYNLRKGFGLPTTEHQDALSAYNFYRLIHRVKRIFFLYNSRTEGLGSGEISRFAHQLHYHYRLPMTHKTVNFDIAFETPKRLEIKKTPEVMRKLNRFLSDGEDGQNLSASRINLYLDCPVQFYLKVVEGLRESNEVQEEIKADVFGNIFHKTMELLYKAYEGKMVHAEELDQLIKNENHIDKQISLAFACIYFKRENEIIQLEGNNLLVAKVLRKYVKQLLLKDKAHAPFKYIKSEEFCKIEYPIFKGEKKVKIVGFIDRIDEKEDITRILDYKTGGGKLEFNSIEELFEKDNPGRPKHVLQTMLYGILYKNKTVDKTVAPGIYYLRNVFSKDFDTYIRQKVARGISTKVEDFSLYEDEFTEQMNSCLEEIFNPDIPFVQSEKRNSNDLFLI